MALSHEFQCARNKIGGFGSSNWVGCSADGGPYIAGKHAPSRMIVMAAHSIDLMLRQSTSDGR